MAGELYYGESETPHKLLKLLGEAVTSAIAWIFFVAAMLASVFGVISWYALIKFCTFRNYVLLSAIIAYMLLSLVLQVSGRFITEETVESNAAIRVIPLALFVYFQMVYQCWLLVLCYVFSVDFLQVFHYNIRKKYLLSNLFAWGVPFIIVLLYVIVGSILINMPDDDSKDIFVSPLIMYLLLIPVALSLMTYIAVIYGLFSSASTDKKCKGFTLATLIFAVSNIVLFTALPGILEKNVLAVDIIGEILEYLLLIALIVFIVVLKSNWKLWRDYVSMRLAPESGIMLGDQRI